jgi:hypothetical protein
MSTSRQSIASLDLCEELGGRGLEVLGDNDDDEDD